MNTHFLDRKIARRTQKFTYAGASPRRIAMAYFKEALKLFDEQTKGGLKKAVVARTEGDGISVTAPDPDHVFVAVPSDDAKAAMFHLVQAFGEMDVVAGEQYVVKVEDDGISFSITEVTGVSPDTVGETLRAAGNQFLAYKKSHEAKNTPDGDDKAAVNAEMAALCFAAVEEDVPGAGAHVMLGLYPAEVSTRSLAMSIEALVERAYEMGFAGDDIMRPLAEALRDVGLAHGWPETSTVVAHIRRGSVYSTYPMTGKEAGIPPVQAVSADPAPEMAPEVVGALLRHSDEPVDRKALVAYVSGKAQVAKTKGELDTSRVLFALAGEIAQHVEEQPIDTAQALREFFADVHARNVKAGWWSDLATGTAKKRSVGELFMLMVTELWEAYDAWTENASDDKLPQYPGVGVELGDLLIRVADFCGALAAGSVVTDSHTRNPGDMMFNEVGAIAMRYEAIRKTPEAVGQIEAGDFIPAMDVAEMVVDKLAFNAIRPDHKIENRLKDDGKRT